MKNDIGRFTCNYYYPFHVLWLWFHFAFIGPLVKRSSGAGNIPDKYWERRELILKLFFNSDERLEKAVAELQLSNKLKNAKRIFVALVILAIVVVSLNVIQFDYDLQNSCPRGSSNCISKPQ